MQESENELEELKNHGFYKGWDVTEMLSFQIEEQTLHCPVLDTNPIFVKMRNKVINFFKIADRVRRNGMTE